MFRTALEGINQSLQAQKAEEEKVTSEEVMNAFIDMMPTIPPEFSIIDALEDEKGELNALLAHLEKHGLSDDMAAFLNATMDVSTVFPSLISLEHATGEDARKAAVEQFRSELKAMGETIDMAIESKSNTTTMAIVSILMVLTTFLTGTFVPAVLMIAVAAAVLKDSNAANNAKLVPAADLADCVAVFSKLPDTILGVGKVALPTKADGLSAFNTSIGRLIDPLKRANITYNSDKMKVVINSFPERKSGSVSQTLGYRNDTLKTLSEQARKAGLSLKDKTASIKTEMKALSDTRSKIKKDASLDPEVKKVQLQANAVQIRTTSILLRRSLKLAKWILAEMRSAKQYYQEDKS